MLIHCATKVQVKRVICFSFCLFNLFCYLKFRERCKHESIINSLEGGITTQRTVHASLGKAEFFEFALKNPYSVDQNVQIFWEDRDVS